MKGLELFERRSLWVSSWGRVGVRVGSDQGEGWGRSHEQRGWCAILAGGLLGTIGLHDALSAGCLCSEYSSRQYAAERRTESHEVRNTTPPMEMEKS